VPVEYDSDGGPKERFNDRVDEKRTSSLSLRCKDLVDAGPNDDLCIIDDVLVPINRNVTTKIMANIVDNEMEEVLWSFQGDWRIFEVRIYEKL
jgi:hypothetical protein